MAELITVRTRLRNNSIVFEWEPLWDDVYDDIEYRLRTFVVYILTMGIHDAFRSPGRVEFVQDTENEWIARGVPVPVRKGPDAIQVGEQWWTLHDTVTPKGMCIPVNIKRRLEIAKALGCEYKQDHVEWFGEMKLRME